MNNIINRLSEIEQHAAEIMDDINVQKKALSDQMVQKTADFDARMEAETAEKIKELQLTMEKSMETQLAAQQASADERIRSMENDYQTRHADYAEQLFKAVLKG